MQSTHKISRVSPWINAGSITVENTDLAVTGRDYTTVQDLTSTNVVHISLTDPLPYALLFRFRSDGSNNVDSVLQLYGTKGSSDHYHKLAQLTIVQGQQAHTGTTIYFVDTITPASEDALFDGEESNAADMIAHYYMRTLSFDKLAFICSDLDTTTVYIDYCRLYE